MTPLTISHAHRIAAVLVWLMVPSLAGAQGGHPVVHCLNEELGVVQETLASDCEGRAIAEDEAAVFRNQRRDYIRRVLSKVPDSRLAGMRLTSTGSGFFVSEDGNVLTSRALVAGCSGVSVVPTFGEEALATVVALDDQADLALLKTEVVPPGIAPLAEGSGSAVLGSAFVAGYPEQGPVGVAPALAAVEVLRREEQTAQGPAMIVKGDIRKGSSGGPLIDTGGNVIGIVVAGVNAVAAYKATGAALSDVGFILPGDRVQRFLTAENIAYQQNQRRPLQPEERLLEDASAFMVQVGCWQL